jgi:hypothetical protein
MAPVTKDELLAIIDDIRERVAIGDSWEGYLNYLMPDEDDPDDVVARVEVRYRIDNLMGQGGMRMIGVNVKPFGLSGYRQEQR